MTAPTQLWTPGWSEGQAGRGIELAPCCVAPCAVATRTVPTRPVATRAVAPARRPLALLAVMLVTFAVVCGLVLLGQAAAALSEVPQETSMVRVGAGETVWDVAERVAPGSDVRAVAARIRELNGMSDSAVEPGVPLRVPDGR
ncbi:MAG: hypothetical protein GEU83_05345 [Pseudonocardiaceae bacterium]|nr:hypothetical protein [Pseudonocardiaceae bacterium]